MRIGMVGGSYTARSSAVADEETINWFQELVESRGAIVPTKAYTGSTADNIKALFGTPGVSIFATLPDSPTRGDGISTNGRTFQVVGAGFYEVFSGGTYVLRGTVANDGNPASLAFNSLQILIVSGGHAYCFTLATNVMLEVTSQLAGVPIQVDGGDTYFIVIFQNSNKFQMSQVLDGTTWPGQLVNEVSVFPENIRAIKINHRELWVFGSRHTQPYQDTGSAEVYDVIPGALIESGIASTFNPCKLDNSVFWVGEDDRGSRICWRSNGYTPSRISNHAVETDLSGYSTTQIAGMTGYACQIQGHLWWVLFIPGSQWNWVYDVGEGIWFKLAKSVNGVFQSHWGWNHVFAFGLHLIGDWNSGNLYNFSMSNLQDNGTNIERLRRPPTIGDEMKWIPHAEFTVDFDTGLGPQPPLLDGSGNPRQPQAMLRWSDNRGKTWSNEHITNCGSAGQFNARAIWRRLGRSRYRVYEVRVSDPVPWIIFDGYLRSV